MSMLHGELEDEEGTKLSSYKDQKFTRNYPGCTNEMEKRVLVCRLKQNHLTNDNASKEVLRVGRRKVHTSNGGFMAPKRSPFHDIGNSLLLMRQNSKAIFPLHSPLASSTENILREWFSATSIQLGASLQV